MPTKNKKITKNNQKTITLKDKEQIVNIVRWIALLVVTGIVIYWAPALGLILLLLAPEGLGNGLGEIAHIVFMFLSMFVSCGLISFFTAKIIAPTNKNLFGLIAVVLSAVWSACLVYGFSHFAY